MLHTLHFFTVYTLNALSETVDDEIAIVNTTVSALNATVDERISAVNTAVSALNATVDERISTVNTAVSPLNAAVDHRINTAVNAIVDEKIITVSTTVGAHGVSIAKLLSQPGKFVVASSPGPFQYCMLKYIENVGDEAKFTAYRYAALHALCMYYHFKVMIFQ